MDEINTQGGATCENEFVAVLRCVIQAVEWKTADKAFFFNTVDTVSNQFPVVPGKGFFVNVRLVPPSGGWLVTGAPIAAPVSLTFQPGFNLVGVPYTAVSGGYDSRQLMDAINTQGGATCENEFVAVLRCAIQAVEWRLRQ